MENNNKFYEQLDKRLKSCENNPTFYNLSSNLESIASKIDWCWRFKKITENQKDELADRVIDLYKFYIV